MTQDPLNLKQDHHVEETYRTDLSESPDSATADNNVLLIFITDTFLSLIKSIFNGFLLLFQILGCILRNNDISHSKMGSENFSKIPQVLCCHSWGMGMKGC